MTGLVALRLMVLAMPDRVLLAPGLLALAVLAPMPGLPVPLVGLPAVEPSSAERAASSDSVSEPER